MTQRTRVDDRRGVGRKVQITVGDIQVVVLVRPNARTNRETTRVTHCDRGAHCYARRMFRKIRHADNGIEVGCGSERQVTVTDHPCIGIDRGFTCNCEVNFAVFAEFFMVTHHERAVIEFGFTRDEVTAVSDQVTAINRDLIGRRGAVFAKVRFTAFTDNDVVPMGFTIVRPIAANVEDVAFFIAVIR